MVWPSSTGSFTEVMGASAVLPDSLFSISTRTRGERACASIFGEKKKKL